MLSRIKSKSTGLAAMALAASAIAGAGSATAASSSHSAMPFLSYPGLQATYHGNFVTIQAHAMCSQWRGIAQLQVGTNGHRVLTRVKYICQSRLATTVRFQVAARSLPHAGNYSFRLLVGRFDGFGVRWTDSLSTMAHVN